MPGQGKTNGRAFGLRILIVIVIRGIRRPRRNGVAGALAKANVVALAVRVVLIDIPVSDGTGLPALIVERISR